MLLLNALLSDRSASSAILSVIRKLAERHITLRWSEMSQDFFSFIRPSPLQKILHEKLIVFGLVNKLSAFLWAPTIFNCVSWSATGPYPEEIQYNPLCQTISFKIYFNIRSSLKHATPKLSLFFQFYDSSFVLTDLLLAAFLL